MEHPYTYTPTKIYRKLAGLDELGKHGWAPHNTLHQQTTQVPQHVKIGLFVAKYKYKKSYDTIL